MSEHEHASAEDVGQKTIDIARARDVGWTEAVPVDYAALARPVDANNNEVNWHGLAKVYEWKDEYGDVAPAVPELEKALFAGEYLVRRGKHIDAIQNFEVKVEGDRMVARIAKFEDAGLHPVTMSNIRLCQYDFPTPIQSYTIPAVLAGLDVVATSQTGSGKTAAYLIPIISKLMGKAKLLSGPRPAEDHLAVRAEPLVVIVVPTRELAIQVFDEARRMCYRSMLRPCVAYGGMPMGLTINELTKACDVLIATPGRLCDLMDRAHILSMRRVKYTVIDEADEMLHSDWEEELSKIMAGGDTNEDADHVYMMFSATFPKSERELARRYLAEDYVRIRVGRAGSAHKNIRQEIIEVNRDNKREAIYDLLMKMDVCRTLIFCNAKITVDQLDDYLYNRGLPTTSIHADRAQREREDSLRAFRAGKAPILIATGVSGRGLDVMGVHVVINYDLPSTTYGGIDEYVHRIGRTARIGNQGLATSFYDPDRNDDIAQDLVNILVECGCDVPDFLQQYAPEEGKVAFNDDTDDEADAQGANDNNNTADAGTATGWGAAAPTDDAAPAGFTADNDAFGGVGVSSW